jgi:SMI1-KNR4 cell-wall
MSLGINRALEKLRNHGCKRNAPLRAISESELTLVERHLNLELPPSYRFFLSHGLTHGLHFEEFLWPETDRDLVTTNLQERSVGLPNFLLSFLSDGYGTQICFDTRLRDPNDECAVVEWERGMREEHLPTSQATVPAGAFATWIIDTLGRELEEL